MRDVAWSGRGGGGGGHPKYVQLRTDGGVPRLMPPYVLTLYVFMFSVVFLS